MHARPLDHSNAEEIDFFCELDPMFDLRIGDDRTLAVTLAKDPDGTLVLTEC